MPFDGIVQQSLKLSDLSALLRDQSQWPVGFEWDYNDVRRCAMGLAHSVWSIPLRIREISAVFRLSEKEFISFFWDAHVKLGVQRSEVTAIDVADQIDAYLAQIV